MKEVWKNIAGYEWLYQISNLCRIKSFNYRNTWKEKILKQNFNHSWYLRVWLTVNWKQNRICVHKLLAIMFINNPENKKEVNHINWIKNDNSLENLEWNTPSENMKHSYKTWLNNNKNNNFINNHPHKWLLGWKHFNSKKFNQYNLDWTFIKAWNSWADIYRELWIHSSATSQVSTWKRRSAWWFIWKHSS